MDKTHRGLTLLELMISLGIITILLGLSLPGISERLQKEQGQHILDVLASSIDSARNAAVNRNLQVTVCPSRDALTCSGSWNDGLIIMIDPEGKRKADKPADIIHSVHWPPLNGSLHWRAFGNRQYLQINALGHLLDQNGNFTWCADSGKAQDNHQLVVNRSGRMRLARDSNGDGFREDSNGQRIECDW